ncbi:MAG: DUF2934 domain-containing protein [Candidatus Omnitrophota bacterium]
MIKKIKKVLEEASNGSSVKRSSKEEFLSRVQKKAYELYVKSGCKPGNDIENWLTAERLVKEELSK